MKGRLLSGGVVRTLPLTLVSALAVACSSEPAPTRDAGRDAGRAQDGGSDAVIDGRVDAGRDVGGDSGADVDSGTDSGTELEGEVAIGQSLTEWADLDDGGTLLVYRGGQGLSHFFASIKERGLAIDPGVTLTYAFEPAEGGASLIYPGAETIEYAGSDFHELENGFHAAVGRYVVLDQPFPDEMQGEFWTVSVITEDALGRLFSDTRSVVIEVTE